MNVRNMLTKDIQTASGVDRKEGCLIQLYHISRTIIASQTINMLRTQTSHQQDSIMITLKSFTVSSQTNDTCANSVNKATFPLSWPGYKASSTTPDV